MEKVQWNSNYTNYVESDNNRDHAMNAFRHIHVHSGVINVHEHKHFVEPCQFGDDLAHAILFIRSQNRVHLL